MLFFTLHQSEGHLDEKFVFLSLLRHVLTVYDVDLALVWNLTLKEKGKLSPGTLVDVCTFIQITFKMVFALSLFLKSDAMLIALHKTTPLAKL
jgi:hypothetical protein